MKKSVAIRELKTHLSQYLKKVRKGEVIAVSDRGKVIAEIRPTPLLKEQEKLLALRDEGLISWNGLKPKGSQEPLPAGKKSSSEYVSEGRR